MSTFDSQWKQNRVSNIVDRFSRLVANMKDNQLLAFTTWQEYNYPLGTAVPITQELIMSKAEAKELAAKSAPEPSVIKMKVSARAGLRKRVLKRNPDGSLEVGEKIVTIDYGEVVEVEYPPLVISTNEWYKVADEDAVMSATYLEPAEA